MDYYKQIKDYRNDNLSPEQKRDFEAEMQRDPGLAKAVEAHPAMESVMEVLFEDQVRSEIREIRKKIEAQEKSRLSRGAFTFRRIAAAAAALILCGILANRIYVAQQERKWAFLDKNELYRNNFPIEEDRLFLAHVDERESETRGFASREGLRWEELRNAQRLLTASDHEEAIAALVRYLDTYPKDNEARWYLAISYLRKGKFREAKALLKKVARDPSAIFQKRARDLLTEL